MTEPTEDELAEFSHLVAELEQRLEQSFAAHDAIITRQAVQAQENAGLRAQLAAVREISEPLAAIHKVSALAAELIGKLNDALKPAALDDKTREGVDELTRLLTGQLEQMAQHARQADSIVATMPPASRQGGSDPWAAEIDALRQEFPGELASESDPASQPLSDPEVIDQSLPGKEPGGAKPV
jgi:hypothetical protein